MIFMESIIYSIELIRNFIRVNSISLNQTFISLYQIHIQLNQNYIRLNTIQLKRKIFPQLVLWAETTLTFKNINLVKLYNFTQTPIIPLTWMRTCSTWAALFRRWLNLQRTVYWMHANFHSNHSSLNSRSSSKQKRYGFFTKTRKFFLYRRLPTFWRWSGDIPNFDGIFLSHFNGLRGKLSESEFLLLYGKFDITYMFGRYQISNICLLTVEKYLERN